ncbi:MAG TPA: hypothetical protein VFI30_02510 [Nocardioidaceae bacterium]|nr:hypothetical protein [Nocardioidaceae bacterium]
MRLRGGTRRRLDTWALAAGSAMSGLLAYVFFALVTRTLGPVLAAPVSVLWTYWSFAAAAVTFPVQHWIARSVAAHRGEGAVRRALPAVIAASVVLSAVTFGVAWAIRGPLFNRTTIWFPAILSLVTLGSGLVGVVRGGLTARLRFYSLGAELTAENALRCATAFALVAAGVRSPVAFGLCLAVGPLVALSWPSTLRYAAGPRGTAGDSPLTFLGGAAGGQLIGQSVLTGGPVVLALAGGGPADVTALFTALALFRSPYTLMLGLVSQLTGRLTRLVVEGRQEVLQRLRLALLAGTVLTVGAATAIGGTVGPRLLQLVFGHQVELSRLLTMVVGIGSALALANLIMTVALLAHNRGFAVTRVWLAALAAGGAVFVAGWAVSAPALDRTCLAFLAAELVGLAAAVVEERRAGVRADPSRSGSPSLPSPGRPG